MPSTLYSLTNPKYDEESFARIKEGMLEVTNVVCTESASGSRDQPRYTWNTEKSERMAGQEGVHEEGWSHARSAKRAGSGEVSSLNLNPDAVKEGKRKKDEEEEERNEEEGAMGGGGARHLGCYHWRYELSFIFPIATVVRVSFLSLRGYQALNHSTFGHKRMSSARISAY